MSDALNQIIGLLSSLDKADQDKLYARLKALRGFDKASANATPAPANADADLVLEVISSTMQGMGLELTPPSQLKLTLGYNAFAGKVPALMGFIRQAAPTRLQQRVLLSLGIRLLYDNIVEAGYPVSSRHIMAQIHRIPSIFDQNFPGYSRAGLLSMLISREEKFG